MLQEQFLIVDGQVQISGRFIRISLPQQFPKQHFLIACYHLIKFQDNAGCYNSPRIITLYESNVISQVATISTSKLYPSFDQKDGIMMIVLPFSCTSSTYAHFTIHPCKKFQKVSYTPWIQNSLLIKDKTMIG